VFDVGGLYDEMLGLSDKRHARGKRHELAVVLVFYILARLAGEDQPCGIADWVRAHRAILCQSPSPALDGPIAQYLSCRML
jgi:hypothetical protein